jgi:hypothetical protein
MCALVLVQWDVAELLRRFFFRECGETRVSLPEGIERGAGQTRETPRVVTLLHRTTVKDAGATAAAHMTG